MRWILLILFSFYLPNVFAQKLSGFVKDAVSHNPIANAQVHTVKNTVITDAQGKFELADVKAGDKFSIRIMGYEIKELTVVAVNPAPITVYLNLDAVSLNTVVISTKRDYKKDSTDIRNQFASVFAYKPPSFTDMFVTVDPSYRSPHANINPNSTASILRFNALSAFKLFGKKNKQTSKAKEMLLSDEREKAIDNRFSKEFVMSVVPLTGNDLLAFMDKYRPKPNDLKQMNGYELVGYIKKSYAEFIKANQ
ncbi:carboxypeptidase-like regulatory domain-containing protein [Pedobacter namyangjuensis]|uniref:carboxypeptidase-like regulatory domain-containing protein n=1 Tax=Pedobacter namyangjuensis TaxID=600626 RepID=UPI000DE21279|nr:carboxypeptidase-like regulatory domain-containing protein [Pedobacter namyangjuensis]